MADSKLATTVKYEYISRLKAFSRVVRETYCTRQSTQELRWPPCFAETLVRLELHREVYDVYYNKQQRGGQQQYSTSTRELVKYDDIFQNKPEEAIVRRVLVEGDAGIGKTTLCTSISMDWAQYRRLKQFELLLLLPLRDKTITSVTSVVELFKLFHSGGSDSEEMCKSLADSIEKQRLGKHILIIADGWDELEESKRSPGSFLYKLIIENAIKFATVMITSRPSASIALHKIRAIDRFIEIAGFDMKGIEQYIASEFKSEKDKRSRLLKQIKKNPLIRSICQVPINCAIICHMWRSTSANEESQALPSNMTMTDMYSKIILHFIFRAFTISYPEFCLECLNSFDQIPKKFHKRLSLLCQLAYDALVKDTFIFSYDDLDNIFPQASVAEKDRQFTFGMMHQAQTVYQAGVVGRSASFHFLHRTFQEYLAALHIMMQPEPKQIELIKPHVYTSRMAITCRFIAGLGTSGNTISSQIVPLTRETICEVCDIDIRLRLSCVGPSNDLVVHGLCEAKDGDVKNYFLHILYGDHFTFVFPRNAHDCATVVKAIKQFPNAKTGDKQGISEVSFKFEHCNLDEEVLASLADALFGTDGKLQVRTLLLQDCNLSDRAICTFMPLAAPAFKSLRQLSLAANSLGAEAVNSISEYLQESSIRCMILSYNPLDTRGGLALSKAVKEMTFTNLSNLQLKQCRLNSSEAFAPLCQVLPDHCANLKQLDISENATENPSVLGNSLGQLLLNHNNLNELYANETNLGDEGIKAMTDVLNAGNNEAHINVLSIKKNEIRSTGIAVLTECILSLRLDIDEALYVDDNPIHLRGAVSLASILNTKSVSMSNCELVECTDDAKESLRVQLSKLPQNKMRQELVLDNTCFTAENIDILVEFIRICPALTSLSTAGCKINSKDLKQLLTQAKRASLLQELETWSLQNNNLENEGCSYLIHSLSSHLCKVTGIFVHDSKITNDDLQTRLEGIAAQHMPDSHVFEKVIAAYCPGVPFDKFKVLWEKHGKYETLEDEEQDPVLLWDEYSRRGEEQKQIAEMIMDWIMSWQDEKKGEDMISKAKAMFSGKRQKIGSDMLSAYQSHSRQEYHLPPHPDAVEENILAEVDEVLRQGEDEIPKPESTSFPDIELPGGRVIPSSTVSRLAAQYSIGAEQITPETIATITRLIQTPLGQIFLDQVLQEVQGSESADINYNAVDTTTLKAESDDLRDVKREVLSLKSEYYQLGVELGIPAGELDAVRKSHNTDLDDALTEVLLLWLRRRSAQHAPPSWQSLVKAVNSLNGGNYHGLAMDIASSHSKERP